MQMKHYIYIYIFLYDYICIYTQTMPFWSPSSTLTQLSGEFTACFFCVGRRVQRHGLLPMAAIQKPPAECRVERIFARGGESNSQAEASKERNGFEMLKLTQQKAHVKKNGVKVRNTFERGFMWDLKTGC